jgi:hypothetical protein
VECGGVVVGDWGTGVMPIYVYKIWVAYFDLINGVLAGVKVVLKA